MDTLEVRVISENVDIGQIIVIHDTVYYTTQEKNHDWNKTNLDFSSPELCWENSTIVQYNDRYMIIQKRRQITRTLLDLQSGETTSLPDIYGSFFCISGDYLYYTRQLTEEEIEHDPLKDYYTFTWEEETISPLHHPIQKDANNKDGGRIYRISLQEEEKNEECVFKFVYKDVPVRISDFSMDGEVMYITFHNYERYRNYFNQEFNSDLDEYISESRTCSHAIVDFQNGTVNIIDMPED